MKFLKNLGLGLAVSALLLTSCDKDAAAEKKLTGTWDATSYTTNGDEMISDSTTMSVVFPDCDKSAATCEMHMTFNSTAFGQTFTSMDTVDYTIEGDGMYFISVDSDGSRDSSTITTLTASDFVITTVEDTNTMVITMKKR